MVSLGLFVRLEAKPGKEKEVAAFLKQGVQMANQEPTTELWFGITNFANFPRDWYVASFRIITKQYRTSHIYINLVSLEGGATGDVASLPFQHREG